MLKLRNEQLHWRDIDGEVVALDARTSKYLSANQSGLLLWRALVDGASRAELCRLLALTYGIDDQQSGADVDRFLGELRTQGLLGAP